jgi:hypothetical protein
MNYQSFTNDSLLMMHHAARGALAVDDELNKIGQQTRFRVRETPDWMKHASDLEAEMLRRGMSFDGINWTEHQHRVSDLTAVPDHEVGCLPPNDPPSSDKSGPVDGDVSRQNDEFVGPRLVFSVPSS